MERPQDQYSTIYYSTMIASIGGFIVGYSSVIIAGVLLFLDKWFNLSVEQQEVVVSISLFFAIVGSLIGGFLCNMIGRKKAIIVSAVIFMISSALAFYSDVYLILLTSRAIMGLGMGIATVAVPLYICEVVPTNIRGSCICVMILELYLGYLVAYLISRSLVFNLGWKVVLCTPFIPALGLLIGMCYMPETPQWLFSNQKKDAAIKALKRLRRFLDVDYECESMENSSQFNKKYQAKFFSKGIFKAVFVGGLVAVLIEITGAHAIYFYIPSLLKMSGIWKEKAAIDAAVSIGVVSFVMSFVAMLAVDRLGRRKLLLWGTSVMILCLICLGFMFHGITFSFFHHYLVVIVFCLFASGFIFGLGSVGWLIIAEIFPLKIRSLLISVILALKWFVEYLISRYFLNQFEFLGATATFWLYALISIVGLFFMYYFVPETTGVSLEIIEEYWLENKSHGIKISEK